MLQNYLPSYGYVADPNVNRIIEDTVQIVNDVDTRLQALKVGIAQAFPHLAPTIAAQDIQSRLLASRIANPGFGAPGVSPFVGSGLPTISPFGTPLVSPFASPMFSPFASPFGAPIGSPYATFGRDPRELLASSLGSPLFGPTNAMIGPTPQAWTGVSPLHGAGSFRLF